MEGREAATRLQERAREARYRLLVDHAKAIGADALVTAHHADDQAETVLFRLLRGLRRRRAAGHGLKTAREGMTIARPLMGLRKRDLVAFADARGAPFVDDPSNADPRFARTRLRALLARLGEEGLDGRGARPAGAAGPRDRRGACASDGGSRLRIGAEGALDARALFAAPSRSASRILQRRIAEAGGRDPSRIGLEKIEALARQLATLFKERRASPPTSAARLFGSPPKGGSLCAEPPRTRRK